MPELPEVETVRRELAPWLTGRRIVSASRIAAPAGPKYAGLERAAGQSIESVLRRGKFLLMALSGGDELVVHLGMSGVLSAEPPRDHQRVRLELAGPAPRTLYFRDPRRFGRFLLVRRGDYRTLPTLAALGPEPFDVSFTPESLYQAVRVSRAPLKVLLLSQRPVAGLGNIYVDEALWRAQVHPLTAGRSLRLDAATRLHRAIIEVLRAAIAAGGTTLRDYRTVSGATGAYLTKLSVYGREGEPCPRCSMAIVRLVVGARSTHVCPRCQHKSGARRASMQAR
ncbi:MAG: bifunctional DNA-formamidopyrimidine glycosylase/DNA-(apurinic or apyrimidinic site) lyase [Myxococcales bacterium]|nr:bifunctional DNA-formamidopyrimidine glycosylase/DNA-(apurinic or apyrimidinic site) lyase [Myxococcales bacterium]